MGFSLRHREGKLPKFSERGSNINGRGLSASVAEDIADELKGHSTLHLVSRKAVAEDVHSEIRCPNVSSFSPALDSLTDRGLAKWTKRDAVPHEYLPALCGRSTMSNISCNRPSHGWR